MQMFFSKNLSNYRSRLFVYTLLQKNCLCLKAVWGRLKIVIVLFGLGLLLVPLLLQVSQRV